MLHETNKYIKEHFLQSENKLKINNIQRRMLGTNKSTQLEQSGRKFLSEFNFSTHNKKNNYYFLFFNDLLIIGKPSKKTPSNFRIIENLSLENIEFQDDIKGEFVILKIKTAKTGATISLSSNYKLIMKPEEKISCLKILSDYKNTLKLNPTVGFDLFKLLQREFPSSDLQSVGNPSSPSPAPSSPPLIPLIPSIITQCIDYILFLDPNLNTEGLFRISCDNRQLSDLRNIFDNVGPSERKLEGYKVHEVACLLKLWLRELPEPLLTFKLYEKLLAIEKTVPNSEHKRLEVKKLIDTIGVNLPTFKYLIGFLGRVIKNSAVNKMTASNVAIVFGPSLLRPQVDTMNTALNSPFVNQALLYILENLEFFIN